MIMKDGCEGGSRRLECGYFRNNSTAEVPRLVPLLEHLNRQIDVLPLEFLSTFDEFEEGDGTTQVPLQFQHFLVGGLVVFTVLTGLHLFSSSAERQIGIVGSDARPLFRFH